MDLNGFEWLPHNSDNIQAIQTIKQSLSRGLQENTKKLTPVAHFIEIISPVDKDLYSNLSLY